MNTSNSRLFYFNVKDWTWWVWTITTVLLALGLAGYTGGFIAAMVLSGLQLVYFLFRERSLSAFPVQLRLAYFALLLICYLPAMRWLFWWPALGTFALIVFGYCLLARVLSLFPWNSNERYTLDRLMRTFFSKPDPSRVLNPSNSACSGGFCTIQAQVPPPASAQQEA